MLRNGYIYIEEQQYLVSSTEMHVVPEDEEGYTLYFTVESAAGKCGFCLWGIDLPLLESIKALDGRRLHLRHDGESYDDDDLGSDILGAYDNSDLNYWHGETDYGYGDIQIDFTRIEDKTYRVQIALTLTDSDEHPLELSSEDFTFRGGAVVNVTVDDKLPDGWGIL